MWRGTLICYRGHTEHANAQVGTQIQNFEYFSLSVQEYLFVSVKQIKSS